MVRTNTKIVNNRIFFNEKFKLTGLNVFRNKEAALISLIEYKATRQSVGLYEVMKPFEQQDIELHKGDTVYLFSDGYADQFGGPKGKKLMYKPFKKLLLDLVDTPLNEQSERIITDFNIWKGDLEQVDDVVVIGFRV